MKPGISGSSGRSSGSAGVPPGRSRDAAQLEALVAHRRHHAQPAQGHVAPRPGARHHQLAWPVGVVSERLDHHRHRAVGAALEAESDHPAGRAGVAAGEGDDAQVAAGRRPRRPRRRRPAPPRARRSPARGRAIGQHRRVDQPLDQRVVGVGGRAEVDRRCRALTGAARARSLSSRSRVSRATRKTSAASARWRSAIDRAPASCARRPRANWLTAGLIPFADQVEDARALRDVVVRLVGPALARVQLTAQPQELAPRPGRGPRIDAAFDGGDAGRGVVGALGEQQRLDGDQLGVEPLGRRRAVGGDDFVGHAPAPRPARPWRTPSRARIDPHRPLVPLAGLPAVGAVGFRGAVQISAARS